MRRLAIRLIFTLALVFVPLGVVVGTNTTPQLGLDLQGGISVVLAPKQGAKVEPGTLTQAVEIIRNRIDSLGVAEPDINRQGDNIIIDLPGVKDRDKALSIVGQTAELRFRGVLQALPPEDVAVTTTTTVPPESTTTTAAGESTTTTAAGSTSTTVQGGSVTQGQATSSTAATTATTAPTTTTTVPATTTTTLAPLTGIVETTEDIPDQEVVLPVRKGVGQDQAPRLRLGPTLMSGREVDTANAVYRPGEGWIVILKFTNEGFKHFQQIAQEWYLKQVAIVLDGVVQSYPTIESQRFDSNEVQITGNFKEQEAKDLALVLKYGALPVPLERQTVQDVSPTLGKEQLHSGVIAGLLGLAFVAVYMVIYYRILGLVIISGLLVVGAILYSITCWLGSAVGLTLTLSGVTGIIVSVGTTVDSYVVYFERLKDEVRAGKTIRSSLDRGFARSFKTILAGNLVSLIGAALLYFLAIGSVRGFAFFLGVTTVLDIFVAYFYMYPVVSIFGRRESLQKARWIGIASGLGVKEAVA